MTAEQQEATPRQRALTTAVFLGAYIPMHDATFELAAEIGERLDRFWAYVAKVRDPRQADDALVELVRAIELPCTCDPRHLEVGGFDPDCPIHDQGATS